jgi:hypothetical protein
MITMFLPAMVISEHNLGPLDEMGSLAICTSTVSPELSTSAILPCLSISGSVKGFDLKDLFLPSRAKIT